MIHGPLDQTGGHPGKEKQIPRTMYLRMWMMLNSKSTVTPHKAIPVTDGSVWCGLTPKVSPETNSMDNFFYYVVL